MEDPSCLALTGTSRPCVYTFHHSVSLLGDTLLLRGLLRTQCGVGMDSKNQSHLTKIGCLVTQTLRQLTHMAPYFKHEEIDAVLAARSHQDSSAQRVLLSWGMSGEKQGSGEHANGFLGKVATGSVFASAGIHWGLGWDPSVCWRHGCPGEGPDQSVGRGVFPNWCTEEPHFVQRGYISLSAKRTMYANSLEAGSQLGWIVICSPKTWQCWDWKNCHF